MNAQQRRIANRVKLRLGDLNHIWARAGPKKELVEKLKAVGIDKTTVAEPAPEVKSSIFSSARAFRNALEKRGFKLLGEGHYSAVYGKDGYDKVIKVSRTLDNWIDYVAWASKNGFAGTFAPKVYSWKRFKGPPWIKPSWMSWDYNGDSKIGNDWSVAVVERMKETLNADSQLARDFKLIERLHDLPEKNLLAEVILDEIVPGVGTFFKKLHKSFRASDIYAKNMMIRQDGTFCVTDPVCGSLKHVTSFRLKAGDFSPPLILNWRYFESSS